MKKFFLTSLLLLLSTLSIAQNLYPKKLDNCPSARFCLDCGDVKADVEKRKFDKLISKLNKTNNLTGIKGKVIFQLLVDSTGKGCVLSHTDVSDNIISRNIVSALNDFDGYTPAKTEGKIESRSSFDIIFEIANSKMTANVQRVDIPAFEKSFDKPKSPEIYNKEYVYQNPNLKNYNITYWNTSNSNLPNNMNDNITVDKSTIWLTVDNGIVTFDGNKFQSIEQTIPTKAKYIHCYAFATDNANTKWLYTNDGIYSFDDKDWIKYDSSVTGITGAYEIINNPMSDEVFFCSDEGLTIYKNGQWNTINSEKVKELPSNRVAFAKRDSKNRIWIGTYSGSVMIDENGTVISFNDTETVLKGKCITSMDEDESGNLYFSLYEFNRKVPGQINNDEGIAIRYTNGTYKQFTTSNSGMPFNHTNKVLYDKNEKVLWVSTDRAGLVRYDLNGGWENYHNENSDIPTSYISTMTFDSNGVLYLATRQGLVKVERIKKQ